MSVQLTRSALTAVLAAATLLLSGCGRGGGKPVLACGTDPDCGGTGRCVAGLCQASAPPVADFPAPPTPVTQREIVLTSTSHDPDQGDGIVTWAWTVVKVGAGCEPELTGPASASPTVVFWCPGTYRISLTVTDSTGEESEPVNKTVEVLSTTSAPEVAITGAGQVHHRCSGAPLRCTLESPLGLAATARSATGGGLAYRWSALAPATAEAGATAFFAPADGPTTTLQVTVPGSGVTGAWAAQVRVRDSEGNLAVATHAFEVANRPPVVRPAVPSGTAEIALGHTVGDCPAGNGRCYLAAGAGAFTAEDPDGDPLGPVLVSADAAGAGAGSIAEAGVGGVAGAFRFSTPLGNPGAFRAGDGASGFHVKGTVSDVHGATASLTLTARIGNRPPVATSSPATVSPSHVWSAATKAYQASTPVAAFADPDGDPIAEAGSTGDAVCDRFSESGGTVSVSCLLAYTPVAGQVPTLATFVAPHAVVARVSDGWAVGTSTSTVAIQNRPPAVPAYSGPGEGCACLCVKWATGGEPGAPPECQTAAMGASKPVTSYPTTATDPDGDPVAIDFALQPMSAVVVANDGVATARGTWTATSVVCSQEGVTCNY